MKTTLHTRLTFTLLMLIFVSACSENTEQTSVQETDQAMTANDTFDASNPFYSASTLPLQYPAFDQITTDHYLPAFERGMVEHIEEIAVIVNQVEDPTFENTMLPLEESGELLNRVATVFFAMSSAHTNDDINEIEVEIAPKLSTHQDRIFLDAGLFARVQDLYERRDALGHTSQLKTV